MRKYLFPLPRSEILVTGGAGFIGYHTARDLLTSGRRVVIVDNLNNYYDTGLKRARLRELRRFPGLKFYRADVSNRAALGRIFRKHKIEAVCHLAAQVGVRHSVTHPFEYEHWNSLGTLSLLE